MKIAVIILAAGGSTRMGKPKQLLAVHTTTLLGITIKNALLCEAEKVFCVLGSEFKKVKGSLKNFDIEIIRNASYKNGLSTSIHEGIKHIDRKFYDAALIMLGDQPSISPQYLNDLINTFKNHKNKVVASNYNNTLGVPAIFPKHTFNKLQELKGDKGAKAFLNSNTTTIISIDTITELLDIDTEEDYNNYLKSLSFL